MNYIVLDLEWNQSNTGKEDEVKDLPFEIIEIGAIKLNSNKTMISEFNELIKPSVYKQMHYMTRKLIHLQMEELEKGKPFVEVVKHFLEWCGDDIIFCTWGPSDLTELQRNMKYYHMRPLFSGPHPFLDIQKLFSLAFEDGKERRALSYAVDFLNITQDIPFHRAFSDAYYTSKVMQKFENNTIEEMVSFDLFTLPKTKKEEVKILFPGYMKYISREFDSKTEAIEDKEVSSTKCYLCRKNIKRKIKWFTPNGKHYYSVSYCNEHGFMKSKIRVKKSEDNKVYIVKTSKFISNEGMMLIKERRDIAAHIKKEKRNNNLNN